MEQLRFQYKNEAETFQITYISFPKTFRKVCFALSQPQWFKTNYKAKARIK